MKVACDFVSPESVAMCQQIARELRDQRLLVANAAEEVLHVKTMLYHTWETMPIVRSMLRQE